MPAYPGNAAELAGGARCAERLLLLTAIEPCVRTSARGPQRWRVARRSPRLAARNPRLRRNTLITLGIILLIIGLLVTSLHFLVIIGGILLVIGLVLVVLGAMGRAVGGRRHYY